MLGKKLLFTALLTGVAACGTSYSDTSDDCVGACRESDEGLAQNFVNKLNEQDDSGYTFKLVKNRANDPEGFGERWIVIKKSLYETEYYDEWVPGYYDYNGWWVPGYYDRRSRSVLVDQSHQAFNIEAYTWGQNWTEFTNQMLPGDVVDNLTPTGGNLYHDPVSGFLFEETAATAKDLEAIGAAQDSLRMQGVADKLVGHLGLSEDRAMEVAKLTNHWQKLSKKRAMTDADANKLFSDVFGVTATNVREAYKDSLQGNPEGLLGLMESAAAFNGIGPEKTNALILNFMK